jgi:hypothetical protein
MTITTITEVAIAALRTRGAGWRAACTATQHYFQETSA